MQYRIGIDLGGTAIKAGVVNEDNQVVFSHSCPTGDTFERVVADMAAAAETVAAMAGLKLTDFPCVGVGTPSCINPNTGRLVFSNNTNWRDMPLREELEKYLPVPVFIGNDANCAIVGEAVAGAAKDCRSAIMLTLGTGVGGGVILDGKLFIGGDGMGAELGHTPVIHNGAMCTCGIPGCLEAYASVSALIQQAEAAMSTCPDSLLHIRAKENDGRLNGRIIFDCAHENDPTALAVIDRYEEYLANGIGGLINVFRPEIFLIGGGLSAQGDYLLEPLREKMKKYVFAYDIIGMPPLVKAALGNAAGTIGAAYLDRM